MNAQMFYNGVVEDIMDPLMIGRVRVRVVGVHTENKEMLPTEHLPWATPILPITSASMNGIGSSPTGLVCGSWVVVFFTDGESKQQPMIMGSLIGIPTSELNTYEGDDAPIVISTSLNENSILPQDLLPKELQKVDPIATLLGKLGLDTSGLDTTKGVEVDAKSYTNKSAGRNNQTEKVKSITNPVNWKLGQTSKQYESGSGGAGTINDYNGSASWDFGGASYGVYQFASYLPSQIPLNASRNAGRLREKRRPSPLEEYVANSRFKTEFSGLTPATSEFDSKWRSVAAKYSKEFEEDQHNYVKRKYYDPVISKLKAKGYNFENNGPAVHDAIWSTSVQFWHGRTISLIADALGGRSSVSDTDFVNLVYGLKATRYPSEANRVSKEKQALLALTSSGATRDGLTTTASASEGTTSSADFKDVPKVNDQAPSAFNTQTENTNQIAKANVVGFTDPTGRYPLADYLNEPDTNRLARNDKINQTIVSKKSKARTTGVVVANNGGTWSQPDIPYASKYPYNHVTQSESGHVFEVDDTTGGERIHVYHKMGTFVEIDNNGSMVRKIVGDDYQIIERNGNIFVGGNCNLTVSGSVNIYSYGNTNIETEGETTVVGYNDISVRASGNIDISSAETITLKANKLVFDSDTTIEVTAADNINTKAGADFNLSAVNTNTKSAGDFNLSANGEVKLNSAGDHSVTAANIYADASGIVSQQNGESKASDFVSVVPIGADFGVTSETRRAISLPDLEPLTPNTRIDNGAFFFETEEETVNSADYENFKNSMIASGSATNEDFTRKPVEQERDTSTTKVSKPLINPDADSINSLKTFPDSLKLSPNFTLGQVSSKTAVSKYAVKDQFGITAPQAVANLQNLCLNVLEPILRQYPNMFVTSGFRHQNSGSKVSDHVLGQAVDMQFRGASKSDYFEIAKTIRQLVPFKQLLLEYKSTGSGMPWIHVSLSTDQRKNTSQVMTFFNHKKHADGLSKLA